MYSFWDIDRRSDLLHRDSSELVGRNCLENYRQHSKRRLSCQGSVHSDDRIHLLTTQRLQFLFPRISARTHSHGHNPRAKGLAHVNRRDGLQSTQRWHARVRLYNEKWAVPPLPPSSNSWGAECQSIFVASNTVSHLVRQMLLFFALKAIRGDSGQTLRSGSEQYGRRKPMCFGHGVLE